MSEIFIRGEPTAIQTKEYIPLEDVPGYVAWELFTGDGSFHKISYGDAAMTLVEPGDLHREVVRSCEADPERARLEGGPALEVFVKALAELHEWGGVLIGLDG